MIAQICIESLEYRALELKKSLQEVTELFDPFENKGKGETPLPPGNVEYSGPFLQLWNDLVDESELEEITTSLLRFLRKILTMSIESGDTTLVNIAPTNNPENCCFQCGVNHEARDFMRAISLRIIDEMEKNEPYLYLLKENNFITQEAFKHAQAKLANGTKSIKESLESRKEKKFALSDFNLEREIFSMWITILYVQIINGSVGIWVNF